ncbi:MAG: helix-turn-helix transcriptional regulator [Thermoanaerobaculia bacterium]|nr:MAG: helix-turn-helix transcriptional regulator [Thermoanaerobaculia bacterium]
MEYYFDARFGERLEHAGIRTDLAGGRAAKEVPLVSLKAQETAAENLRILCDLIEHSLKERGFTQVELAEKIGLVQALVSDYERGKLRLNAEMLVRFALVLEVSTDQLVGLEKAARNGKPQSRRIQRRLQALETLPKRDQEALLRTIDAFLAKTS